MIPPFFFFNDPATTEIYPLSLHDALPIYRPGFALRVIEPVEAGIGVRLQDAGEPGQMPLGVRAAAIGDRKSTRLNSSHPSISYAVFCLKKKKIETRSLRSVWFIWLGL